MSTIDLIERGQQVLERLSSTQPVHLDTDPVTPHNKRRQEIDRRKLEDIGATITNLIVKQEQAKQHKSKEDLKKSERLEEQKNRQMRRQLRCKLNKVLMMLPQVWESEMKRKKNIDTMHKRKVLIDYNLKRKRRGQVPVSQVDIGSDDELDELGRLQKGVETDYQSMGQPLRKRFQPPQESPMSILRRLFSESELAMIAEDLTYFVLDDALRKELSKTLVGKTWDELLEEEGQTQVPSKRMSASQSLPAITLRQSLVSPKRHDPFETQAKIIQAELKREKDRINMKRRNIINEQRFQDKISSLREMEEDREEAIKQRTESRLEKAERNILVAKIQMEKSVLEKQLRFQKQQDRVKQNRTTQSNIDIIIGRINKYTSEAAKQRSQELKEIEHKRKLTQVRKHLNSWSERICERDQHKQLEEARRNDIKGYYDYKVKHVAKKRESLINDKAERTKVYNEKLAQRVDAIKKNLEEKELICQEEFKNKIEAKLNRASETQQKRSTGLPYL